MLTAEKLRFAFDGVAVPEAPIHLSFPDPRDKGEPSCIISHGTRRYMVTATTLRGGYRRYAAKNILAMRRRQENTPVSFTSETARVLLIGGVKGSGDSAHLTPEQLQQIRTNNPLLDVFGMGDPVMFGGTLFMGFMISDQEIHTKAQYDKVTVDPETTLPIIRRSLLTDPTLSMSDISDPETMMGDAAANRRRSQITTAVKLWERLSRKQTRNTLSTREAKQVADAKETIKRETDQEFETADEARHHLDTVVLVQMRAEGRKDVSEQNIQSTAFIPAGVQFSHKMELHNTTRPGVGLFLHAMHDKYCFNPIIGGLAARGCGGYPTFTYNVRRQEGYTWHNDCTLVIRPNTGLEFSNDRDSVLKQAFDEWESIDIKKYHFDYDYLKGIITNGGGDTE